MSQGDGARWAGAVRNREKLWGEAASSVIVSGNRCGSKMGIDGPPLVFQYAQNVNLEMLQGEVLTVVPVDAHFDVRTRGHNAGIGFAGIWLTLDWITALRHSQLDHGAAIVVDAEQQDA